MEEICNEVILDLKRRAKKSKEEGDDKVQAIAWLKQAKAVEDLLSTASPSTLDVAQHLKKLAVYCKQQGDIEAAKDALIKSKQISLMQQQVGQKQHLPSTGNEDGVGAATQQQPSNQEDQPTRMKTDNGDGVGYDDDEAALKNLMNSGDNDDETSAANVQQSITFTDEEMGDQEMMMEFQLAEMPVPSQKLYAERILHHKKLALAWKQKNDIPKATAELRLAKQLQDVQSSLLKNDPGRNTMDGNDDDWMKTLTPEESELLGELMNTTNTIEDTGEIAMMADGEQQPPHSSDTMAFDLNDVETMDDDDIKECMNMGMSLPSTEDIQKQAARLQKEALECKKIGNIDLAKSKLSEYKKATKQAERLGRIYSTASASNNEFVSDADLVALLSSPSSTATKEENTSKSQQEENPWRKKRSAEIKMEVIRLKNMKKVSEATGLLKIYKEVLTKENQAKEIEKCQTLVQRLEKEIDTARKQIQLFSFYTRFVDQAAGSQQLELWQKYIDNCQNGIQRIQTLGSESINISSGQQQEGEANHSKFYTIKDDDIVGLVESSSVGSLLQGNLEVCIMEVQSLHESKAMQKFLSKIRNASKNKDDRRPEPRPITLDVDVKLQLPVSEDAHQSSVHFMFHPINNITISDTGNEKDESKRKQSKSQFVFAKSQIVDIPRGDSRPAKTIVKRMETKKVQINVSARLLPPPEKKSWFFSSSRKEEATGDGDTARNDTTNLGKVVLDLKDLLIRNCVVGDFPLTVNSKEVGGMVRLCIRTDQPFDVDQFEGELSPNVEQQHPSSESKLMLCSTILSIEEVENTNSN